MLGFCAEHVHHVSRQSLEPHVGQLRACSTANWTVEKSAVSKAWGFRATMTQSFQPQEMVGLAKGAGDLIFYLAPPLGHRQMEDLA
jgi:hypothetical protein